jgi:hypothetical protein
MLLGTCVGFVGGFFHYGWRTYPWAILPFVFLSIVLLHPVMEKDVPSLVGADMLREASDRQVTQSSTLGAERRFARNKEIDTAACSFVPDSRKTVF